MGRIFRHDAIMLHNEVSGEEFESFMKEELVPYFSKVYKGPTRTSYTDLKDQSLLKDTEDPRKYLWITVWSGESVRGSFENTRMVRIEETEDMLKKLDSFGKRNPEKVFNELVSIKIDSYK